MQISIRDEDYLALLFEDNGIIQAIVINQKQEKIITNIKCSNNWGDSVEDILYHIERLRGET